MKKNPVNMIGAGIAIGVAIGVAIDNIMLGLGIGLIAMAMIYGCDYF
jgi:zinc transporter ZupT